MRLGMTLALLTTIGLAINLLATVAEAKAADTAANAAGAEIMANDDHGVEIGLLQQSVRPPRDCA